MQNSLITVQNLSYEYPRVRALHNVSFEIPRASATALVGPNGAGKSTLLRCLAALDQPFSGKVIVDGVDTEIAPREVHRKVGYLADFYGLYDELSARQCLRHVAAMHRMDSKTADLRIDQLAGPLEMRSYLDAKTGALSRGQRQRVAIAQAIIHNPPLLLLDEPAAGLDPEARHSLSVLINDLRRQGLTIIISSHILAELQDYSTHMLTVQHGEILGFETLGEVKGATVQVELRVAADPEKAVSVLKTISGVGDLLVFGDVISFVVAGALQDLPPILKTLIEKEVIVIAFSPRETSMQEVYFRQVKEKQERGSHES